MPSRRRCQPSIEQPCVFCGNEAAVRPGRTPPPTPFRNDQGDVLAVCRELVIGTITESCWSKARKRQLAQEYRPARRMDGTRIDPRLALAERLEGFFALDAIRSVLEVETSGERFMAILRDRLVNGESTDSVRRDAQQFRELFKNLLVINAEDGELHYLVTSAQDIFGYESARFEREVRDARRAAAEQPTPADAPLSSQELAVLYERCQSIAEHPRILDLLGTAAEARGLVGEARAAKLLFLTKLSVAFVRTGLANTIDQAVSGVVKGPSSAGKNHIVKNVLAFFPPSSFWAITSMSERALIYGTRPLSHRTMVMFEASGLGDGEFLAYLVRSLISEGRVNYETVERTPEGMVPRVVEREGPTNFISTTTKVVVDEELETRVLGVPVDDSAAQTKAILKAHGRRAAGLTGQTTVDLSAWHALVQWLTHQPCEVLVTYGEELADRMPSAAVRLRRDFTAILGLIKTHALLHQQSRQRNGAGQVLANEDDYEIIASLVSDVLAESIDLKVSPTVRATVEAAIALVEAGHANAFGIKPAVSISAIARHLGRDKSAVSRHVATACGKGYLRNEEPRNGFPAKIRQGDVPMPAEGGALLPSSLGAENRVNTSTVDNNADDSGDLEPNTTSSTLAQRPSTRPQRSTVDPPLDTVEEPLQNPQNDVSPRNENENSEPLSRCSDFQEGEGRGTPPSSSNGHVARTPIPRREPVP